MNEAFVAQDGNSWFVVENEDHCDAEGNWGMSSRTLAGPFKTQKEADEALSKGDF